MVDMVDGQISFILIIKVTFNVFQLVNQSKNMCVIPVIDIVDKESLLVPIEETFGIELLAIIIKNIKFYRID